MPNQKIELIDAIAIARGTEEPTNRDVFWLDKSLTGGFYDRLKSYNYDTEKWELVSRSNQDLLSDLKTVDGAGSGLDSDTLQGYTPDELISQGASGLPAMSTGKIIVGQSDSVGKAKTLGGIATIDVNGSMSYVTNSISHTGLTDVGTNTHAQIDTHIADSAIHLSAAQSTKLGHISVTQAVDLDQMETDITANNAKVTNATHTGDVTGATALTIADDAVTNAKLADVASQTIKGKVSAGSGNPEDLTAGQVRTIINVENGAEVNPTDSEIETAYNNQVAEVTQAEAEAGTLTDIKRWTPQRVKQAIDALAGGSSSGKFGIPDSSGAYTYYSDFQTALNAASSGDTVEMFTNVTVSSTTTLTLIDGVNINMNGYKYENSGSTNVNMVTLPSSATVTIYNGYFKRSGGTNGVTSNVTLDANPATSSNLYLKGVTFENTISTCLYIKGALVEGGTFIGNGGSYSTLTAGPSTKMIGSTFIGTSSGHVGVNSTTLINCTSYANSGMAFYVGAGILLNCVGESISNIGIRASGGNNTLSNCTGKSESNYGIRVGGDSSTVYTKCKNTTGFSSSNYGFYIDGFAEVRNCDAHSASLAGALITSVTVGTTHKKPRIYNCTFISEGANGAFANGSVQMFDSSFISQYDNANGHGLTTGNVTGSSDPTILSGCTFQCENASANGFKNTLAGYETKIAACKFHGMTTDINDVNSNQMSNTPDSYNNILI